MQLGRRIEFVTMNRSGHRQRRSLLLLAGGIGGVLITLAALSLFVQRLGGLESMREKIKGSISREVAGTVDFQKMKVSLFPPRVVLEGARFSLPGTAEGTVASLRIYPRFLPLLSGKVRVGSVQAESLDVSLILPERGKDKPSLTAREMEAKLSALLDTLALHAPRTSIAIEKGSITVSGPNHLHVVFRDLNGRIALPPADDGISLTCSSDFAKGISVGLRLAPGNLKGAGILKLTGMKPQRMMHSLFPESAKYMGDSEGNLMLSFKMTGFSDLHADVQGSFPSLVFLNAGEKVLVKGMDINGALTLVGGKVEITINELKLDRPRLSAGGVLILNEAARNVSMEISGSQIDVPSLRETALSLAPEVPIVRNIFQYVRGGQVPFITVRSQGVSLEDLGRTESIFIRGLMRRGEVFVPGPKLDFREVNGDCVISRGMLEGQNIEATLGNSQVRDGKLRVGLKGNDVPLHVEAAVKADLTETKDILKRLMTDEPLQKEIERISSIRGEARGRVTLGENTASLQPGLVLSEISFTTDYQRLPFPLIIRGGRFTYDGTRVGVKDLRGSMGKSSFERLTGEVRLGNAPTLDISSGGVRLVQDEVSPWLKSLEELKGPLRDVRSARGTVSVDTLALRGPLLKPEEWHFRTTGRIEDLDLDLAFLPGPVSLKKGTIAATEERFVFTDVRAAVLDAGVSLSGMYQGYLRGRRKTDLTFQGRLGLQSLRRAAELVALPPYFSLNAPVTFERARVELDDESVSLQGQLKMHEGPDIAVDVRTQPEGLAIRGLTIRDRASDATLSLDLREKRVKVAFTGNLTSETLHSVIKGEEFRIGRISGDFQAEIRRGKDPGVSAQGAVSGENISFPLVPGVVLTFERLSIAGLGDHLAVPAASLVLGNTRADLQGTMRLVKENLTLDMDLSADRIEWEALAAAAGTKGGRGKGQEGDEWDLPLTGTLRVKAGEFVYGKYTWRPFHAAATVHGNEADVAVNSAVLCGISSTGMLKVSRDAVSLDFQFAADNQELAPTLTCLSGVGREITGTFDLRGKVKGGGRAEHLLEALQGNVEVLAKGGRIYRDPLFFKILDFLRVSQILRGFPEIRQEGFPYESIQAKGKLRGKRLEIREAVLDSSSMKIAAEGFADLESGKMDLGVLVSPMRKTDLIIRNTPLIGSILGGTLISIPLHVTGEAKDLQVSYNPVSAVGSGLFGIMERTIKAPVKLFDPFLPAEEKERPSP